MSPSIAIAVFVVVHVLCGYLLRASGTWRVLFGPTLDLPVDRSVDPLTAGGRDWIDNHEFWELAADDSGTEALDDEVAFWGERHIEAG